MLSKKVEEAINRQINAELYSAYLYLSMAAYLETQYLPGFAHWLRVQNREETSHAMKLFDFVTDRDGRVELQAISQPPTEFQSALEVMQRTLEHEREVTVMINRLYEMAVEESDYPLRVLLHWFIEEQVEEEKNANQIVEQMKLIGDGKAGLLMLDARMRERS